MRRDTVPLMKTSTNSSRACRKQLMAYQSLLDSSSDVNCTMTKEGIFLYVSAAAETLWGYAPQELIGSHCMNFIPLDDHTKTVAAGAILMSGEAVTDLENRFLKKDGTMVPVLWSARWSEPEQVMYCVAKDASFLKSIRDKKQLLNSRLRRAYQLANLAWWEYDVATQILTNSDEIFAMYGLPIPPNNQMTLEDFLPHVHPDDRPRLLHDLAASQDGYVNYEHRIVKPTGEIIHVVHYSDVVRDEKGNLVAIHGTTKEVTDAKRQQQQLQESEQRLSEILESIGNGFFTVDHHWTVTYWNKKAEELLGKKREQILGKNLWQEYHEAVSLKFYTEYHRAVRENIAVQFEDYYPPTNMWIEASAFPSAGGLSVYFKDVTERKRQEQALKSTHERFHLVCRATKDVIWDWDLETKACYIADSFFDVFGYHTLQPINISSLWRHNLFVEDKCRVISSQQQAIDNPAITVWEEEYRFRKACGGVAHVIDRAVILRNQDGRAIRMVGAIRDISEQKKQEQRLQFMAKAASEVIWEQEAGSEVATINAEKFNQLFGYNIKDNRMHRSFWWENVHPADAERIMEERQWTSLPSRDNFLQEYRFKKKDGSWAYVRDRTYRITNSEGRLVSVIGAMEDITLKRAAEMALYESEKNYRKLFESAPLPTLIYDPETLQCLDANRAAIKHFGYSKKEFLSMTLPALCPLHPLQKSENDLPEACSKNKTNGAGSVYQKKNGESFYTEVSTASIIYKEKRAVLTTIKEVTENLKLQEQLIKEREQKQKQIARAMLHAQEKERSEIGKELHDNVCQLLTTAKLYIENIKYMPDQQEQFMTKGVGLLIQSINEIRYLSRQLVSPVSTTLDFKAAVNELLVHYQSMNLFAIRFYYAASIELVNSDLKTSIIRILQEQFNNTVKYAGASAVYLCISNTTENLLIRYEDNGCGFDPDQAKKGIGLVNIKNRAGAYGGTVKLQTAPGEGCSMEISFPLSG